MACLRLARLVARGVNLIDLGLDPSARKSGANPPVFRSLEKWTMLSDTVLRELLNK